MEKIRKFVVLTLLFSLVTSSLQGQDLNDQEIEESGSAYVQSSRSAHWSVYVPIAILAVAAIWFGVSDRNHKHPNNSSDSQDGLGSIASRKRQSSKSSSKSLRKSVYRSKSLPKGGYSHN